MSDFTARSALQTGLDLIRRRPLLILLWAALTLAQTVFFTFIRARLLEQMQAGIFAGAASAFSGQFLAFTAAASVLSLMLTALLWTSAFRAILRPAEGAVLALGLEELCVFVSWVIIQLVVATAAALLPVFVVSHFGAPGDDRIPFAIAVVETLGLLWSAVASAWAFDRRRVGLFRCWTIAGDRIWLLAVLVVGVDLLQRLIKNLATVFIFRQYTTSRLGLLGLSVTRTRSVLVPPRDPLQEIFDPAILAEYAFSAVIGALLIAIVAGVVASAYRTRETESQADAFS